MLICGTGFVGLFVGMGVLFCYQKFSTGKGFSTENARDSMDLEPFVDLNGQRGQYHVSSDED